MTRNAYNRGGNGGGAAGSVRETGRGGWGGDVAWAGGDGWGDEDDGGAREGGGQTLVHETHAPKRISHIQFGLLNAEVRGGGDSGGVVVVVVVVVILCVILFIAAVCCKLCLTYTCRTST